MAANLAAMRGAFTRIRFSVEAAARIVDDQQIDSLEELRLLTDNEVENLCKTIRRPGGTVPNPAGAGAPVPNPGVGVSTVAENNMKMLCYWL